ncbi:DNA-binding protein [Listeria floridensis FSL S10-1187]|uniref:DNA-binding protein n=1 Tax=Listeria floridensis FSL S10-1187 TaxID=1265817 RepID=A0ABP3B2G6_9LIST|nr:helix-turn-helix domain-containing protein [Listeria floridensis]EUJ33497.1 DNA-binding protein [Listeria floridensis FSL S10-1187]
MNSQDKDRNWLEATFLTTEEAARFLGVSRQALLSLVKREKIPCAKKGKTLLFHKLDLKQRQEEQMNLRDKFRPYDR